MLIDSALTGATILNVIGPTNTTGIKELLSVDLIFKAQSYLLAEWKYAWDDQA